MEAVNKMGTGDILSYLRDINVPDTMLCCVVIGTAAGRRLRAGEGIRHLLLSLFILTSLCILPQPPSIIPTQSHWALIPNLTAPSVI